MSIFNSYQKSPLANDRLSGSEAGWASSTPCTAGRLEHSCSQTAHSLSQSASSHSPLPLHLIDFKPSVSFQTQPTRGFPKLRWETHCNKYLYHAVPLVFTEPSPWISPQFPVNQGPDWLFSSKVCSSKSNLCCSHRSASMLKE